MPLRQDIHRQIREYVLDQLAKGKELIFIKLPPKPVDCTDGDLRQLFDEEFKALVGKIEEF